MHVRNITTHDALSILPRWRINEWIVKNGMPYLKSCIHSINSQKEKNIEHLVVYSKSTDNTLTYLKSKKKRIIIDKYSNNKFGSLNLGIKKSSGNYVCILHADDMFYSKKTIPEIIKVLKLKHNWPKAIIANTIKGKGFSFSENNNDWHHKILTKEMYELALSEIND